METVLIIIGVVFVVLIAGGGALLAPRRRRRGKAVRPADSAGQVGTATAAPPATRAPADSSATAPAEAAVMPPVADAPAAPAVEKPPPSAGRMTRLRSRLARSQNAFGAALLSLLSSGKLDDQTWDEIEEILITADMGAGPAAHMVERLRTEVKVAGTTDLTEVKALLRGDLLEQVGVDFDRTLHTAPHGDRPAVLLVVGVNGTGKTTTCGKLARVLIGDGRSVLLGAADTFRAAAADQLETWGNRVGAKVVRADREGADPASVAFEAVGAGIGAGRRHRDCRHRGPAAHQDRADGRARQDQARHREARHGR